MAEQQSSLCDKTNESIASQTTQVDRANRDVTLMATFREPFVTKAAVTTATASRQLHAGIAYCIVVRRLLPSRLQPRGLGAFSC